MFIPLIAEKEMKRYNEAKREAIKNAINFMIENEMISYQVLYKKGIFRGESCYERLRNQNIPNSDYKLIEDNMSHIAMNDFVSLNPTRRGSQYRWFITAEFLQSQADYISKERQTQDPDFWGKCNYYNDIPSEYKQEIEKNGKCIRIESDKIDNHSYHYKFGARNR